MSTVWALAVLALSGAMPARWASDDPVRVALLALPAALFLGSLSVVITLLVPVSLWLVWGVVVIAAAVGSLVLLRRRGRSTSRPAREGWVEALTALLPLGVALILSLGHFRVVGLGWDARSIWALHARLLTGDAAALLDSLRLPVYSFTHPDYPEGSSFVMALGWLVGGSVDYRQTQLVIGAFTVAAVGLAGYEVARVGTGRAGRLMAAALGSALAMQALIVSGQNLSNGYVDTLWAALAIAAVAAGLVAPADHTNLRVTVLLCVAAASVKSDALPIALAVIALTALRLRWAHSRSLEPTPTGSIWRIVAVGLAAVALWPVVVAALGIPGRYSLAATTRGLLANDPTVVGRLEPSLTSLATFFPLAVPALAVIAMGALALRSRIRFTGVGGPIWTVAVGAVGLAALLFAYLADPAAIDWLLRTSVTRAVIFLRLALTLAMLVLPLQYCRGWPFLDRDDRPTSDPLAEQDFSVHPPR